MALLDNILCWLDFSETSGTSAADASGNGNAGTVNGNPVWGGGALSLDANGDYVAINQAMLSNRSNGTVIIEHTPGRAHNSGTREFLFSQTHGTGSPDFSCQKFTDNNLYIGWYNSGNDDRVVIAASTSNWQLGTRYNIAITWTLEGTTTVYVNGVSAGTKANTTPATMASELRLGYTGISTASTAYYLGSIHMFAAWGRALSGAEIASTIGITYPGSAAIKIVQHYPRMRRAA